MFGPLARRSFSLLLLGCLAVWTTVAVAQPGGGFRGRGRGGFDSLISFMRSSDVRDELKVTEEQSKQIDDLRNRMFQDRDYFQRYREASDEERDKMRAERQNMVNSELLKILSKDQFSAAEEKFQRKQQLDLQRQGFSALERGSVERELGLNEDQQNLIRGIMREYRDASSKMLQEMRDQPDDKREEIRAKYRAEWEPKFMAVLNAEQKKKWTEMLGPPAGSEKSGSSSSSPTATASSSSSSSSKPASSSGYLLIAAPPGAQVVASFASVQDNVTKDNVTKEGSTDDKSDKSAVPAPPQPRTVKSATGGKSLGEKTLAFNFKFAPWEEVLQMFANEADLTLNMPVIPPGTFNYYDDEEHTINEVLDILNSYLIRNDYILVPSNKFLVVVKISDGIPPNLIPNVAPDDLENHGKYSLMRMVYQVEGQPSEDAAKEVKELLGPQGNVVALGRSNRLVITDIGLNLRRIKTLLDATIIPEEEDVVFKTIVVQHIDAYDAEDLIRDLFGMPARGTQNIVAMTRQERYSRFSSRYSGFSRFGGSFGRGGDDRGRDRGRGSSGSSSNNGSSQPSPNTVGQGVKLAADPRTNSLLVVGTPQEMKMIETALKSIDTPEAGKFKKRNIEPYLHVYQLETTDADDALATLNVMYPGKVIHVDDRRERVHVMANEEEQKEIARTIQMLDGLGPDGSMKIVEVIPLARQDPLSVKSQIDSLFLSDGETAPTIEADSFARRLLFRGTQAQHQQVKALLAGMGEDGTGTVPDIDRGPLRTIPLGGRDPKQVVELLEKMWGVNNSNPIRKVIPSQQQGPIRERRIPSKGESVIENRPDQEQDARPTSAPQFDEARDTRTELSPGTDRGVPVFAASQKQPAKGSEETSAVAQDDETALLKKSKLPVTVAVQGGDLMIYSEDQEALDRLEDLIYTIAERMPAQQQWTVYYLTSADATQTATMLGKLFPDSSVTSTSAAAAGGGGMLDMLGGAGGGLFDLAGLDTMMEGPQTLKIIPEARSNALWVAGPVSTVNEVEKVLQILDESELPEQLRERAPRPIKVEYADVNDVHEIVSDLYHDDMQPSNNGRQQQNPLAAMMGGGRSRGGSRGGGGNNNRGGRGAAGRIRLTLSVDERTNTLWVGAADSMYQQIDSLVETLDNQAKEANRTVRVYSLKEGNSDVFRNHLTTLMPKVVVSTSTSSSRTRRQEQRNSSRSTQPQQQPQQSGPSSDDIRRMMEFRQRLQQSRGGGSDRSSSRSGNDRGSFGGRGGFGRGSGGFGRGGSSGGGRGRFGRGG